MRFMVIESFRDGDPAPIYARFKEKGRMLPDGLIYLESWLSAELDRCFQLMETDDVTLFDAWTAQWDDLVDFEIVPVIGGGETAAQAVRPPTQMPTQPPAADNSKTP